MDLRIEVGWNRPRARHSLSRVRNLRTCVSVEENLIIFYLDLRRRDLVPVEVLNTVLLVVLLLLLSDHHHVLHNSMMVFLYHCWRHASVAKGHHSELLLF